MRGRRVGVWAADPITAAGIMALLPVAGFEAVIGAEIGSVDALLIATDTDADAEPQLLTAAADVRGIPVVWMHRRHDVPPPTGLTAADITIVRSDLVPVEQVGQALLSALLSRFELQDREPAGSAEAPAPEPGAPATQVALLPVEREVLRMLADGRDTAEIAGLLFYSERTVKNTISRAVRTLGAVNRAHAVAIALRGGHL